MGLSWITVLKAVPWSDVVRNAPAIADGARKLWENARKKTPPAPEAVPATDDSSGGADPLASQLGQLQAQSDALQQQMAQSGALINALATQNTELVRRVELLQKRQRQLGVALALLAVALLLLGVRALAP